MEKLKLDSVVCKTSGWLKEEFTEDYQQNPDNFVTIKQMIDTDIELWRFINMDTEFATEVYAYVSNKRNSVNKEYL